MGRHLNLAAITAVSGLILSSALAQQPREKPREFQILGQYVGDWTSDVTSKPAVWTTEEKKFRTSNHAQFGLDDWFLQHIEVNQVVGDPEKVTKALWFQTFDPQAERFVMWFFQSSGVIGKSTGTWDQKIKSFSFTPIDLPPNATGKHTEAFTNDRTITGSYLITQADGRKLFDMVWTRERQAGVGGKPVQVWWAERGTPIEPIPAEVKRLQPFIGEWDSEFIQRPSVVSPNGNTSKGRMTGEWILDERFLLGTSEAGNYKSTWVIGYDSNKEAYRNVRMSSNGQIEENIGPWNDATGSFEWKVVNGQTGITRTATNRIIGTDAVQAHIIAEGGDGKVHMDLTIRSTRRK